ncbi:hypothetical protein MNV49_001519 [Pseudohyphozyma bogoriensis]|nr:hypothetical protein MNV49_001519 [Pseudohyphozyma bogoriensis]
MSHVSSSLKSLQDALELASAAPSPLSPSHSAATGDTGSSESPGRATRSLIGSVANHEHLARSESRDPRSPLASSVGGRSDRDSPVHELRLPGSSIKMEESASSESWADVSLPSLPAPGDDELLREVKAEEDSDSESYIENTVPITDEQEEEGLRLPVTRSLTDIDLWLRTTHEEATGDGMSSVGSEALSAVADATRYAHLGLVSSRNPPQQVLGSPFTQRTPSIIHHSHSYDSLDGAYHSELVRTVEGDDTYDLQSLLDEEPVAVRMEDSETKSHIKAEEEYGVELQESPIASGALPRPNDTPAPTTPRSSALGWKLLSLALGVALTANVGMPYLSPLINAHTSMPPPPALQPLIAIVGPHDNSTLSSAPPTSLGSPFPSATLPAVAFAALFFGTLAFLSNRTDSAPPRTRESSPLLEQDPVSVVSARALIADGTRRYALGQLTLAASLFLEASQSRCSPRDKAMATEWLGRTRYRLARAQDSSELMSSAVASFQRAVRLDGNKATSRASLGRALYVLRDCESAKKSLQAAIKKDATLPFAHEYLGKTLAALGDWTTAEHHLREATRLDPMAYTAHAFLGEKLHTLARNAEAKAELHAAVALRADYPAAHARLAFIATEELDRATACEHFRKAIACRETGCIDDSLPVTLEAIQGPAPYLRLYFALGDGDRAGRIDVLRDAVKMYPHDLLISVLLAAAMRKSKERDERRMGLSELRKLEEQLEKRVRRFKSDVDARGLLVLTLLGLGKVKDAEKEYGMFWTSVGEDRGGSNSVLAFIVMAIYELKRRSN